MTVLTDVGQMDVHFIFVHNLMLLTVSKKVSWMGGKVLVSSIFNPVHLVLVMLPMCNITINLHAMCRSLYAI
jgi:hypothetical protein